jgi:hypothetical protein
MAALACAGASPHPRRIRASRSARAVLVALASLGACAPGCAPSGDDPLSTLSVYAPESGEYRLRYLEPPWQLVRSDGTSALVRIPSNSMIFADDAGLTKYELAVSVEPGTIASHLAAERSAAQLRGEEIVEGPREVTGDAGRAVGQELLTRGSVGPITRNGRYVFFQVDAARVVRLAFEATPPVDTPEVDAMIDAFGVGLEGS